MIEAKTTTAYHAFLSPKEIYTLRDICTNLENDMGMGLDSQTGLSVERINRAIEISGSYHTMLSDAATTVDTLTNDGMLDYFTDNWGEPPRLKISLGDETDKDEFVDLVTCANIVEGHYNRESKVMAKLKDRLMGN